MCLEFGICKQKQTNVTNGCSLVDSRTVDNVIWTVRAVERVTHGHTQNHKYCRRFIRKKKKQY